jgi:hypothetical protein
MIFVTIPLWISGERRTVLRTDWGVHFYEISSLISGSGVSNYMHSFAVPWPKANYANSKLIKCTEDMGWYISCKTLNRVTNYMNKHNYELFSSAAILIQQINSIIPNTTKSNGNVKNRRKKRNIFSSIGQAFTDLFHMPGHKDIQVLKNHLEEVAKAVALNTDAINLFNNDLSSTQVLLNNRVTNIREGIDNIENSITNVVDTINSTFGKIGRETQTILNRTNQIAGVMSYVTLNYLPGTLKKHMLMNELVESSELWHKGITTLLTGYLSNVIVPIDSILNVIHHINKNVLSQPRYNLMELISVNPTYYYKQKNIMFTIYEDHIIVTVKFPLRHIGGLMTVYKTDTFPVPLTSGLKKEKGIEYDESYTHIKNIPKYFAITGDGEYYLTMSSSLFESCDGEEVKVCEIGMPSLQRSTTVSCVSALFFDDTNGINSKCEVVQITHPLKGSAILLSDDNTLLIHGTSDGKDTWRLRCIKDDTNSQQALTPCSMCRIKIPCFCTLGADDFQVSTRMTQCSMKLNKNGVPETTYLYHPNLVMITTLYPDSILSTLQSSEAKINSLYPSMIIMPPDIRQSNWSDICKKDNILQASYRKIVEATNKGVIAYESKEDKIDQKVKDFSDVIVDRTTDIKKAIGDLFNIFGSIGHVIAVIFSPFGLSIIALVLSILQCTPQILGKCCPKCNIQTSKRPSGKKIAYQFNVKYKRLHDVSNLYSEE